ncbi:MAG: host attachment protein [Rhizobiales bacterium]|nr:host attachment protein [Hyphomicrobiales bacterium]
MELKLKPGTWVVVCDGRKTIVLENIGDTQYPDLRTRSAIEAEDASTSDLGTDRPGRVHQSVGTARSAVEQTDWHDRDEQEFLKALAARLDKSVLAKEVSHIVIVAPPRALGVLRKAYSQHVKEAIVAEIDKDLASHPVSDIEKHLFGERAL